MVSNGNFIDRKAVLTNLDHKDIPETEPQTKEHSWVGSKPLEYLQHKTPLSEVSGRGGEQFLKDSMPQRESTSLR